MDQRIRHNQVMTKLYQTQANVYYRMTAVAWMVGCVTIEQWESLPKHEGDN